AQRVVAVAPALARAAALEHHVRDAAPRQLARGGQARRPAADHDRVHVHGEKVARTRGAGKADAGGGAPGGPRTAGLRPERVRDEFGHRERTTTPSRHVPVAELTARLSEYLGIARAGGEVVVTERGTPIARLVPVGPALAGEGRLARLAQ